MTVDSLAILSSRKKLIVSLSIYIYRHVLNTNNTFGNVFKATPVIAFCKLMKVKRNAIKGEWIPRNTSQ